MSAAATASASSSLSNRHFAGALTAAAMLHVAFILLWMLAPKDMAEQIPIRTLNLRLGDGEELQLDLPPPAAAPEEAPAQEEPPVGKMQSRAESDASTQAAPAKPARKRKTTVTARAIDRAARQYVRTRPPQPAAAPGSTLGNSTAASAESIQRYEQLISAWLAKFKFYPEEAKGATGRVILRVRLDRQGNVRYSTLETGATNAALNRAAMQMLERANPFPAMPADYRPDQPAMEYKFPVTLAPQ